MDDCAVAFDLTQLRTWGADTNSGGEIPPDNGRFAFEFPGDPFAVDLTSGWLADHSFGDLLDHRLGFDRRAGFDLSLIHI